MLLLLEASKQIDVCDGRGRTALHYAAYSNSPEIVQLLIDHKYTICLQDEEGLAPAHYATISSAPHALKQLLQAKADPNLASTQKKFTPLHIAADQGDIACLHVLLTYGRTDIGARDYQKRTALHLATMSGEPYAVRQLLATRDIMKSYIWEEKSWCHLTEGYQRLSKPPFIGCLHLNSRDEQGQTALHLAVE